jgi:hypothetical protein
MKTATTDRIRLFGTGRGIPFETAAPFPLKLTTWLRMVELPFDIIVANDPRKELHGVKVKLLRPRPNC